MFLHRCKSYQFKKTTLEPNPTAVNWHQFDSWRFLCGKCSNGFENTLNSNYFKWNKGVRWPFLFPNYSRTSIPWHFTIWDFRAVFWCYHTMPSELRIEFYCYTGQISPRFHHFFSYELRITHFILPKSQIDVKFSLRHALTVSFTEGCYFYFKR